VKLAQFTGRFEKGLSLFKLHGSINNYIIHSNSNKTSRVHLEYGIEELYKETKDSKSRKITTVGAHENVDPDFLTRVNSKIRHYKGDSFYNTLFTHLKKN